MGILSLVRKKMENKSEVEGKEQKFIFVMYFTGLFLFDDELSK